MLQLSHVQKASGCFYLSSELDGFYCSAPVFGPLLTLRCKPESYWDEVLPQALARQPRKPE